MSNLEQTIEKWLQVEAKAVRRPDIGDRTVRQLFARHLAKAIREVVRK